MFNLYVLNNIAIVNNISYFKLLLMLALSVLKINLLGPSNNLCISSKI